jgi:hypothetical protein
MAVHRARRCADQLSRLRVRSGANIWEPLILELEAERDEARAEAKRLLRSKTDGVDALIDAIDLHHEALAEDVLVEQIAASMLMTDAMTPSGAAGVYVVHEDDVEVLARDALATIAAHDDTVAKHEQEVRATAEELRVLRERDVLLARIGEEVDTAEIEHALPAGPWGEVVETVISLVQTARVVAIAARADALTEEQA